MKRAAARRPRLVTGPFLLVTLATFAYFTALGSLTPTLPLFVKGPLGGGAVAIGLSVGIFNLAAVPMRPFIGRIGDRRGRRILLVGGSAVIAVGILSYTAVTSVAQLVAVRFVTGFGEGLFYVGAASAINDMAPEDRRGEAISIFSLALYGGLIVGPVMGETVLGDGAFDRVWVAAAIAGALAVLLSLRVPDTRTHHPVGRSPFLHKSGLLPGLVLGGSIWGLASFNSFVPVYAVEIGLDGSRFVFATFAGVVLLIRSLGRRLPDRLGAERAASTALICNAAGLALIALWAVPAGLYVGAAIFAIGQALAFPALMTLAVRGAPATDRGVVIGTFTAFFDLFFGIGALTLGGVVAAIGLRANFLAAAGVVAAGLFVVPVTARRARSEPIAS